MTDKHTHIRTFRLIEKIGGEDQFFRKIFIVILRIILVSVLVLAQIKRFSGLIMRVF